MTTVPETRQLQGDGKKPESRENSVREPAEATNDESAALLSAGHDASDAVHAVQYGTLSTSPTAKSKDLALNQNDVRPRSERGKSNTGPSPLRQMQSPDNAEADDPQLLSPRDQPSLPTVSAAPQQISFTAQEHPERTSAKLVVDLDRQTSQVSQGTDAPSEVGELPEMGDDDDDDDGSEDEFGVRRRLRRGLARSGSITEQIIDGPGGLRKLVLETTSSSEDAEHEAMEAAAAATEDAPSASATSPTDAKKQGDAGRKKKRRHKKHGRKHGGHG